MPKSRLQKKGTVKPMEWVETINSKGKGVLGERPLKPSRLLRRGHMEHPGDHKNIKLGVPLVQLVRSWWFS